MKPLNFSTQYHLSFFRLFKLFTIDTKQHAKYTFPAEKRITANMDYRIEMIKLSKTTTMSLGESC